MEYLVRRACSGGELGLDGYSSCVICVGGLDDATGDDTYRNILAFRLSDF